KGDVFQISDGSGNNEERTGHTKYSTIWSAAARRRFGLALLRVAGPCESCALLERHGPERCQASALQNLFLVDENFEVLTNDVSAEYKAVGLFVDDHPLWGAAA